MEFRRTLSEIIEDVTTWPTSSGCEVTPITGDAVLEDAEVSFRWEGKHYRFSGTIQQFLTATRPE
jgi:hypothetical protein